MTEQTPATPLAALAPDEELLDWLATCTRCGQVHEFRPPRDMFAPGSWSAEDGHAYRTRFFAMFGTSFPHQQIRQAWTREKERLAAAASPSGDTRQEAQA